MDINNLKNCPCGKTHRSDVKNIITGNGAINKLPEVLKELATKKVFLLADCNTYSAAGESVAKLLSENGIAYSQYVFPDTALEPDEKAVGSAVMHYDKTCDAVVAIGSGVINDIGKILSNTADRPYIIVATAPSMDGYASATSSMTMDGLKVSLPSRCADVIIGDTDILKNAPEKMLKAGIGDMVAKYISIAEWRISHLVTGEYYCEAVADLVRCALKKCVDNADGLLKREDTAVEAVFEGLIIGGIAMAYAGLSRPASGVEHYISHVWDMRGASLGTPVELHGLQCALGTLIAVKMYEKFKKITPDKEKALACVNGFDYSKWSEELRAFLGASAESMIALEEKEQKYDTKKHEKRLDILAENFENILQIIYEEIPTLTETEELFVKTGLPTTLAEIGLDEEILPMTFKATKDIRDKYVLSSMCWDLGILDEITEDMI